MALDLMLKNFLASSEFTALENKNWTAVSKLVPGTTARQCQRRYEELMKEAGSGALTGGAPATHDSHSAGTLGRAREDGENRGSIPGSAKVKGGKQDRDGTLGKSRELRPLSGDKGPSMVIRVCDEAKNVKQDFHCPRDLLVHEMHYFAEYFAADVQRWEEVDISVHCDVQIFDWLMKYVKRGTKEVPRCPQLGLEEQLVPNYYLAVLFAEAGNVISILISSDFLKMETLVQQCIEFCHKNMNAIIATPCNMNCINDKLVARIADLFDHNEADAIYDRKDKFKGKLFAKKLEMLFEPNSTSGNSPESAASLFRCDHCKQLLTKNLETRVKCLPSRMCIDQRGNLSYIHTYDSTFDINDYLLQLKKGLQKWRDVYWRVWGTINYLDCSRCGETFPCTQLGHCRYHGEPAEFEAGLIGEYPCCGLKTLKFDPTLPNRGCKVRDHVVTLPGSDEDSDHKDDLSLAAKRSVYNDLLKHRDCVCLPFQRPPRSLEDQAVNVFALEEQSYAVKVQATAGPGGSNTDTKSAGNALHRQESRPPPRLQALTVERQVSFDEEFGLGESDDEVGDEEEPKSHKLRLPRRSRITVDPEAILVDAPDFSTTRHRKWDCTRSLRWNQDAQREEDQRRMNEIVNYLTKLRISNTDKPEKQRPREYAGGIFSKLEAQWKFANIQPSRANNPTYRNKARQTPFTK